MHFTTHHIVLLDFKKVKITSFFDQNLILLQNKLIFLINNIMLWLNFQSYALCLQICWR